MAKKRTNRRIQEVTLMPKILGTDHLDALANKPLSTVRSERPYKSKFVDALDFYGAYRGVKEKQTRITFDVLRRMAKACEPMSAIVQLRCNQVGAFAKLPRYESDTGFRITTRDPDQKIRKTEEEEISKIQKFLMRTGFERNPERRDNLDTFLRKITRDSLVLDAYAFEIVPGKNAKKNPISEIWAVDGATIRLAEEEFYQANIYPEDAGDICYIQEIDGRVTAEYTLEELAYGVRNPQTDVDANGYGVSELEMAINLVTSILYAEQYNRSYFSNNSTPRGIISILGNYSPDDLESFKRHWRAQLEGPSNAWRTPMMAMEQGQGIQFIPLDQKGNRDMEYSKWLEFLVLCLCALYQTNPEELGFSNLGDGGKQALSESSPEAAIEKGEDKGLAPLLMNVAATLNHNVIEVLNEDFSLEFAGIGNEDKMRKQQYFTNWLNAGVLTVNEVRETALDMKPIKEEWAEEAPAQATLYQAWAMKKQQEQAALMPGPGTAGGPMMPPNNVLGQHPMEGDDKQPGGEVPPKPNFGKAPGQGNPGMGQPPQGASPKPNFAPPAAPKPPSGPKPFGKSLVEDGDVFEFTIEEE
jgi:hypothetical protein